MNAKLIESSGMLAMPAGAWIYTEAVRSFLSVQLPPGSMRVIETRHTNAGAKRNEIIRGFLGTPRLQWLYFNDSDQLMKPNTVRQLLANDLPLCGGLVLGKISRHYEDPNGSRFLLEAGFDDEHRGVPLDATLQGELIPVDWVGGGSMCIRRDVLETIPPPWFPPSGDDEDVAFCRRARAAGFTVHLDASVHVAHLQLQPVAFDSPRARLRTVGATG